MSLIQIFDIASSGMSAESVRMNVIASNLSNQNSVGSSPETTYRAKAPIFTSSMETAMSQVRVSGVEETQDELRREYRPGHPLANEEGYIYLSNVNPIMEMANMISASRAYQDNVQVMQATKHIMMQTINLLGANR